MLEPKPSSLIAVRYQLEIKEEALRQLRSLPKEQRRKIGWRLEGLQRDLAGMSKN